jgi:hypothetical protein
MLQTTLRFYYVVGNGTSRNTTLQGMVHRVKYLELCLGCHLKVVRVPRKLMDEQGNDRLSRGVWITSFLTWFLTAFPLSPKYPTTTYLEFR